MRFPLLEINQPVVRLSPQIHWHIEMLSWFFGRSWVYALLVLIVIIVVIRLWSGPTREDFIGIPRILQTPPGLDPPPRIGPIQSGIELGRPRIDPIQSRRVSRRRPSRPQLLCREIFERLYGCSFPPIEPAFLRNPETGRHLEIDGGNLDLMLGFEYNGIQHYVWPNWTNSTYEAFVAQIRRDRYKRERCDAVGFYLITIPYWVKETDLEAFIIQQLPENRNPSSWNDHSVVSSN